MCFVLLSVMCTPSEIHTQKNCSFVTLFLNKHLLPELPIVLQSCFTIYLFVSLCSIFKVHQAFSASRLFIWSIARPVGSTHTLLTPAPFQMLLLSCLYCLDFYPVKVGGLNVDKST